MKIFLPLLVQIGSFFTRADNVGTPVEVMAQNARMGSRKLQSLSPAERAEAINFIADALVDRQEELLRVNKKDLAKVSYFLRFAKTNMLLSNYFHFESVILIFVISLDSCVYFLPPLAGRNGWRYGSDVCPSQVDPQQDPGPGRGNATGLATNSFFLFAFFVH